MKDFFIDSLEKTYQGSLGATNAESPETAEIICVKYGPCPLNVSAFECTDVTSSFIRRVCYDAPKSFMVIKLKETWYPYCEIDAATVQQLLSAGSAGTFYNDNIAADRVVPTGHSIAAIIHCRNTHEGNDQIHTGSRNLALLRRNAPN